MFFQSVRCWWVLIRITSGALLLGIAATCLSFASCQKNRSMFSTGWRGFQSIYTHHIAARRLLILSPPLRSYSRGSNLFRSTRSLSSDPRASEQEDVANLDTVPSWSVDPRTQEVRPGSNWTYNKELFALARRLGYDLADLPKLRTALTHRSGVTQPAKNDDSQAEEESPAEHNSRLSFLGRNLLQYFVAERLLEVYPDMQADALLDLCKFLFNDEALVKCADYVGITELIQSDKKLGDPKMHLIIVRALYATVSCLHIDQGPAAARKFVTEFITSKLAGVDLHEVIKLQHPRFMLKNILASQGLPRAESRLLKETGRATHFPTFVVGVYSGERLLGEGCGTSLKRAEGEAILDALHKHFATQLSSIAVPLEGFEREEDIDFFQPTSAESNTEQAE